MTLQHKLVLARLQIPHPQGCVARASDSQVGTVRVVLMLCSSFDSGWGTIIVLLSIVVLWILTPPVITIAVREAIATTVFAIAIATVSVAGIIGSATVVGDRQLVQFETPDGSCMSRHHKTTFARVHVPHAEFAKTQVKEKTK
jgi:hypothetical protein